jgi:hypothetical protein
LQAKIVGFWSSFGFFLQAHQRLQISAEQISTELSELERLLGAWRQGAKKLGTWRYFRSLAETQSQQKNASRLDAELNSMLATCEEATAMMKKNCILGAKQLDDIEDFERSVLESSSLHPSSADQRNPSLNVGRQDNALG